MRRKWPTYPPKPEPLPLIEGCDSPDGHVEFVDGAYEVGIVLTPAGLRFKTSEKGKEIRAQRAKENRHVGPWR